ncbi:hypothetical protein CBOM_01843 [Ceraceosorus bombacis]|uniref:Uncharacterized protein n=1 Tax=Ceraceosorus bombacis TaxID=401625 RepID=A0A0P1BD32_9BASI|nr:hypothetical protein CBOM_01843 [Ceraceosorus bombacis]
MARPIRAAARTARAASQSQLRSTGFSPTLSRSSAESSPESELALYPSASGSSFALPSQADSDESDWQASNSYPDANASSNRNAYGQASTSGPSDANRRPSSSADSASEGEEEEERAERRARLKHSLTPRRKNLTRQELDMFDDLLKVDMSPAAQWLTQSGLKVGNLMSEQSLARRRGKRKERQADWELAQDGDRRGAQLSEMDLEITHRLRTVDGKKSSIGTSIGYRHPPKPDITSSRWPSQQVEGMALIDELQAVLRAERDDRRERKRAVGADRRASKRYASGSVEMRNSPNETRSKQMSESPDSDFSSSGSSTSSASSSSASSSSSSSSSKSRASPRSDSGSSGSGHSSLFDAGSNLRSRSLSPPQDLLPRALRLQSALFRLLHQCTPSAYILRPRLDGQSVLDRLEAAGASPEDVENVAERLKGIVDLEVRGAKPRWASEQQHAREDYEMTFSGLAEMGRKRSGEADMYSPLGPCGWSHFRRRRKPSALETSHYSKFASLRTPNCDVRGVLDDPLLVPSVPASTIPHANNTAGLETLLAPKAFRRRRTVLDKSILLVTSEEAASLAGAPIEVTKKPHSRDGPDKEPVETFPANERLEKVMYKRKILKLVMKVEEREAEQERINALVRPFRSERGVEEEGSEDEVQRTPESQVRIKQEMHEDALSQTSQIAEQSEEDRHAAGRVADGRQAPEASPSTEQDMSAGIATRKRSRVSPPAPTPGSHPQRAKRAKQS